MTTKHSGYGICPECGVTLALRRDGALPAHRWTTGAGRSGACAGSGLHGAKPRAAWGLSCATERVRVAREHMERSEWDRTGAIGHGRPVAEIQREFERRSEALRVAEEGLRLAAAVVEALG